MNRYLPITYIYAREILDSRGNPTVEAEVVLDGVYEARASVPSGASTGQYEAVELRDGQERYLGLGVEKAVSNVNTKIANALLGENALSQGYIDHLLIDADGTENKSNLGANAILPVSMAVAKASAKALGLPLYQYLGGIRTDSMPVPMMNILNGGRHSKNSLDFQEFMILPVGAENFKESIRMGTEVYHKLKLILNKDQMVSAVGDEGGFAPDLKNAREALEYLMKAVELAGYDPGKDVVFAMDAAASELLNERTGCYDFPGEGSQEGCQISRSTNEMIDYYESLTAEFPLVSIEDGLAENDWEGWQKLTCRLGQNIQLVGDDLFVTNTRRISCGIKLQTANAVLIKLNQIGTLTETFDAIHMAHKAGYRTIISHRSGETSEDMIADLAVACGSGQIKTGAPCRAERTAKYNQLLRIQEELGELASFRNPFAVDDGQEKSS
ncbi:phosphopyruvate hydratase [Clostridiaceae bacterium AM27-36LB]|nr:phosphopyruvate hydratase [Clostridiales bacterium AM23-16LB]RHT84127.1 phosphopyruvate hydratase [Clostridiaceae bacterium AM27-36LB]RHW04407.1 phosphopyruvate hydratase [Clostridiaceae bacterium OF09-1]